MVEHRFLLIFHHSFQKWCITDIDCQSELYLVGLIGARWTTARLLAVVNPFRGRTASHKRGLGDLVTRARTLVRTLGILWSVRSRSSNPHVSVFARYISLFRFGRGRSGSVCYPKLSPFSLHEEDGPVLEWVAYRIPIKGVVRIAVARNSRGVRVIVSEIIVAPLADNAPYVLLLRRSEQRDNEQWTEKGTLEKPGHMDATNRLH